VDARWEPPDPDVFARAGVEHAWVSGDIESVGRVLLDYLVSGGG
jgi:hypothetical protein